MKRKMVSAILMAFIAVGIPGASAAAGEDDPPGDRGDSIWDIKMKDISDAEVPFERFRGKALLIVNTASECGYTPQYAGLQELYRRYSSRGFEVLGIPANDFGGQEPGTNEEILEFVRTTYDVSFPMFGKSVVKGTGKCPLYRYLTEESGEAHAGEIRWNFTKFLIDPDGRVVARFESGADPLSPEVVKAVEAVVPSE